MNRTAILAAVGAGALLASVPAPADVWKRVDERGVVHLSDRYMGSGSVLIMRSKRRVRPRTGRVPRVLAERRARFENLIDAVARRYSLNERLVHAVVRAESAYDPEAVSRAGAVGLMQLMPATAKRYGVRDRRNPEQNVRGGVRYLRDLLLQFRNLKLALAAYNAGENAVIRYGNRIPPFPETRKYVDRVIRYYRESGKPS